MKLIAALTSLLLLAAAAAAPTRPLQGTGAGGLRLLQSVNADTPLEVDLVDDVTDGDGGDGGDPQAARCYLDRFRTLSHKAKEAGRKAKAKFKEATLTSVIVQAVAMVTGSALVLVGYRLVEFVLLLGGFVAGFVVTFELVGIVLDLVEKDNCYVLGIVPLVGGLLVGWFVQKAEKTIFFSFGAVTGLCLGQLVYVVALSHITDEDLSQVALYVCLILAAILGGLVAIKVERQILAVATSLIGSFLVSAGFWNLLVSTGALDPKWSAWVHPCMLRENPCKFIDQSSPGGSDGSGSWGNTTFDVEGAESVDNVASAAEPVSPEVLVPVILWVVLWIFGSVFQIRSQKKRKDNNDGGSELAQPLNA